MSYKVKEIYYTLQGEGFWTGRPAVFCRFTGCNLWSGREEDREKAICSFCDTDFVGVDGPEGGRYSARDLAIKVRSLFPDDNSAKPYVVCTGGEPLLQLDQPLIEAFHEEDLEIAIETNGTLDIPKGIDWVCVSPKAGSEFIVKKGHELKLVYPQPGAEPELFEELDFENFFLQPMDGPNIKRNQQLTLDYCLNNPKWSLSLQTHKILQIP